MGTGVSYLNYYLYFFSMERLPTLQYQLIGEFHTLLEYPASSAISRSNLLQMMAINIFAIGNTAAQGSFKLKLDECLHCSQPVEGNICYRLNLISGHFLFNLGQNEIPLSPNPNYS